MEFRDQVKSSVDIVELIGKYVRLKRVGSSSHYKALCPFHQEKTPSFSVHATHQFYHCFGCGEKGDIFSFVMKVDGLTFYEALTRLAEDHGIPLPKRTDQPDADTRLRAALYSMNESAQAMFRANLNGPAGREALTYLRKRGVSPTAANDFGLGLSESGHPLARRLQQEGYSVEQLEASGLVGRREDGSFYDRFRARLMFPIHNEAGKLAGFGGRALNPDESAKYINSPETLVYKKALLLYNLYRAKDAIRRTDQAIVVEGYMDVIGVFDAGVREVMAPCGTSLTVEQIKLLKRHTTRVVVNFDPDRAGAEATEKTLHNLLEEGMHIRVLHLSDGLDPDEFVRRFGVDSYRDALKKAPRFFDWLADRVRQKFDFRNPESRVEGFRYLVPTIKKIPDKLERITIAKDLAASLGVDERIVREQFRDDGKTSRLAPPRETASSSKRRDVMLLFALLNSEKARDVIVPRLRDMDIIGELPIKQILIALFDLHERGEPVVYQTLEARLDEEGRHVLSSMALSEEEPDEELALTRAHDCLKQLELEDQELFAVRKKAEIRDAERAGDMETAMKLMRELMARDRNQERKPNSGGNNF